MEYIYTWHYFPIVFEGHYNTSQALKDDKCASEIRQQLLKISEQRKQQEQKPPAPDKHSHPTAMFWSFTSCEGLPLCVSIISLRYQCIIFQGFPS